MLELFLHFSADCYDVRERLGTVLDSVESVEIEEGREAEGIGVVVQVNSFAVEMWTQVLLIMLTSNRARFCISMEDARDHFSIVVYSSNAHETVISDCDSTSVVGSKQPDSAAQFWRKLWEIRETTSGDNGSHVGDRR